MRTQGQTSPDAEDGFDAATVQSFAAADEIEIVVRRSGDGDDKPVPIWVVTEGDGVFVRSVRGARGRWYRELMARPEAKARLGDRTIEVYAVQVGDGGTIERVDEAYRRKYGDSPYLPPLFAPESRPCTVRLRPR